MGTFGKQTRGGARLERASICILSHRDRASFHGHDPSYNLARFFDPNHAGARGDTDRLPSNLQNTCAHHNEASPIAHRHTVAESNNLHASGNGLSWDTSIPRSIRTQDLGW